MEVKINVDDQKWISSGKDDATKDMRKTAVLNLVEMNGLKFDAGIGKSYIAEKHYFQIVNDKDLTDNINAIATTAMNWDALGRGIGGLAGAGVRDGIKQFVSADREFKIHNKYNEDIEAIVSDFVLFTSNKKDIIPFWATQSLNVLGLASAIFNREMHHWNAENTKPQLALLAALNQQDTIPDGELRKLFYLSIHPVPLNLLEGLRQNIVDGKQGGINDAVVSRCRSAPAGTGDIHACAQAVSDLISEAFYNKFGNAIKHELDTVLNLNIEIINNAGSYHAFAANYGKERVLIERSRFKRAMICLCAYIFVNIKGSLASSAALKKFKNANARMVQKWIVAFEAQSGENAPSINDLAKD